MVKPRMFFGILNTFALVALIVACGGSATPTVPAPAASIRNPTLPASSSPAPTATVAATTVAAATPTLAVAASAASPTQPATARPSVPATVGAAASAPAATASDTINVKIVDFAFDPAMLTVPVGTKVTWTNTGVQHTVLSVDGLFSSKILERGDTFSFVFDKAGMFDYVCGLHPNMKAMVMVQ